MRARSGPALTEQPRSGLVCEQSFKPEADALHRAGHESRLPPENGPTETYPLVLLLPPRQRDEARASMARAIAATRSGGTLIACAANDAGARSAEADLARIAGPLETLTKNRCRVFWASGAAGTCRCGAGVTMVAARCTATDLRRALRQPPGSICVGSHRYGIGTARAASAGRSCRSSRGSRAPVSVTWRLNCCCAARPSRRSICTKQKRVRSISRESTLRHWLRARSCDITGTM